MARSKAPVKMKTASPFADRRQILERLELDSSHLTAARRRFPVQWPHYYLDLVQDTPKHDPIAKMGRPAPGEWRSSPGDLADPVADRAKRPNPFIVRKHSDRIIVLATKHCHFYCRFCFRRDDDAYVEPTPKNWDTVFEYLQRNPEIKEVILSGGDPLTLSDSTIAAIRTRLEGLTGLQKWRIHTRAPVHYPQRVTPALVDALSGPLPLRIVTHYNHPRELTPQSLEAVSRLMPSCSQILNQAVLLRQVNDSLTVQSDLWRGLAAHGVAPHYLHHPDRAQGNAPFRKTIAQGLTLFRQMKAHLPKTCLPKYVLDLPDGSGKVPVADLREMSSGHYRYHHPDGSTSEYRDIPESA